jgi:ferric-dicitrate binding protein FerR (iron transport regulator)
VRHYDRDTSVTVAVRDGKVAVGPVVVAANHQVDVAQNGSTLLTAARPGQFSFAHGTLLLDGVRFKDAIPELNRWYNADIRISDSTLAESQIRVSLSAGSVTDLAMVFEFMLNAVAERQGQILTFHPK